MEKRTNDQIVNLWGLQWGNFMDVIISSIPAGAGTATLEFQHSTDAAWVADPNFDGTPTGGVIVQRVKCLSAKTRIRFQNPDAGFYHITLVWDEVGHF